MAESKPTGNTPRLSRRNFMRTTGSVLAVGAAAPVLASCSRAPKSGQDSGDGFTLYTSSNHAYETWKDVVKKFESDHGVSVNWQKYPWKDMKTKLQADFSAGNVPDLVEQNGGYSVIPYAMSDDALSLQTYIDKDGSKIGYPDDWNDQSVAAWKYHGQVYGIQLQLTCNQLYYNKKMLDDAGVTVPTTWSEFLAAAERLTNDDVHGTALNQDYSFGWAWMLQNGVKFLDTKSMKTLQPRAAALEALEFQRALIHEHKVSPVPTVSTDPTQPAKLLSAERVAMIFTGPWDIKTVETGNPDLRLGLAMPLKKKERSTYLAGSGLFIPKKSPKADLAWDLIKRLSALDTELKLTKEANQTMARKSWAANKAVKSDPKLSQVAKALEYAVDWEAGVGATGKGSVLDAAFDTLYQSVLMKNTPAEKAMKAFDQAAEQALG